MNIKKEYIKKTKEYLEQFSENRKLKQCLLEEIKLLKQHIDMYNNLDWTKTSGYSYKGIEDLIITEENKIDQKETQIDIMDGEERVLETHLKILSEELKKLIEIKYLNEENRVMTSAEVAFILNISEPVVSRKYNVALKKIAKKKFGNIVIEIKTK